MGADRRDRGGIIDILIERAHEERHLHGRSTRHVHDRIREEDWIAIDVGAAQVEQPADLIEGVEHEARAALLLECVGHARELARDRLSRERRAVRTQRTRRAIWLDVPPCAVD